MLSPDWLFLKLQLEQGVHLEVDDSALQPPQQQQAGGGGGVPPTPSSAAVTSPRPGGPASAASGPLSPLSNVSGGCALPLRPGGVVTLPLTLAVGQAPRGTFREVSLEVRVFGEGCVGLWGP